MLVFWASADLWSFKLERIKNFYHEEHEAHEEKQKYDYIIFDIKILYIISSWTSSKGVPLGVVQIKSNESETLKIQTAFFYINSVSCVDNYSNGII